MTDQMTSPRNVACPKCRARDLTACKRIKKGTKVQVEFMTGFHAERRAAFKLAKANLTKDNT